MILYCKSARLVLYRTYPNKRLSVRKGQAFLVPIIGLGRDKEIWGEDADEFNPERWSSVPLAASAIPGVWGNMLTFFGGPRACIGYRFSIVELVFRSSRGMDASIKCCHCRMKAILFTLIRKFEFELAFSTDDLRRKPNVIGWPHLLSQPEGGNQLPLKVKLHTPAASSS